MKYGTDITYLISAENADNSALQNTHQHVELLQLLKEKFGSSVVKEVQGCYKGRPELSVAVVGTNEHEPFLVNLLNEFGQEGMLKVYPDQFSEFVAANSKRQPFGRFVEVSEEEALSRTGYTKFGDKYYTIEG